jgi:hypothetical protein
MPENRPIFPGLFTKNFRVFCINIHLADLVMGILAYNLHLADLFTGFGGFVYEKMLILADLFTKNRPLLTYSNRNITAPGVRLTLPPGRGKIVILSCCPVFLVLKNKGRGDG